MSVDIGWVWRQRFTQINDYAFAHGFLGGFPNFHQADYGNGMVMGNFLLRSTVAEWQDVPLRDLGNFHANDVPAAFRAVNDWKTRNGFEAAFPNMHRADYGDGPVCGVIILNPGVTEWKDIPRSELQNADINAVPNMFTAANDWAVANGFEAAFPNFHQADYGNGVVYGVFLVRPGNTEWRDIPEDVLNMFTNYSFDAGISFANRVRLLERYTFAYSRVNTCGNLNSQEKANLLRAFRKSMLNTIETDPDANASAPRFRDEIRWNFDVLFPQGNTEIAQTLIHEMMHIAGYTHPDRRDPPAMPVDTPGDNGPYYGTPPLRAELCIAGMQSLTSAEAFATPCSVQGNQFTIRPKPSRGPRVRIISIAYDPAGSDVAGEYVLLRNDGMAQIDLNSWTIRDLANHIYRFSSLILAPGGDVRLWTKDGIDDAQNVYWRRRQAVWNNTGDTAILEDATGGEIMRYVY